LVFDLDPAPDVKWPAVAEAAHEVRERLQKLGLRSFVKSTGGKGLHVVVPLRRDPERFRWEQAKAFCKALAQAMEADSPSRYLSLSTKAKRRGKIYVDYLRNARGATSIAPYSTRARTGAPISVPLGWDELASFDPAVPLTLRTLGEHLGHAWRDPWRELPAVRQRLSSKVLRLVSAYGHPSPLGSGDKKRLSGSTKRRRRRAQAPA
ncbi:MAG TPA: DNA primase small subunit domain-containing protein, partial [Polyangia bacterium]